MTAQATQDVDALDAAVTRITNLIESYQRSRPYRAPETVPAWQAQLLNDVWTLLKEAQA